MEMIIIFVDKLEMKAMMNLPAFRNLCWIEG